MTLSSMLNIPILITGANGFLGQHVVRTFEKAGANQLFTPSSQDYDLRQNSDIVEMLQTTQPQIVIHMAAMVGGIGANKNYPAEFFYNNLLMGTQFMHEAWRAGVKKFVVVGTVCSYPKHAPIPFQESDLWNGYPEETNAPYGLAKKMLLVQGQAYRQQYGFNVIHLLPANLYGPGDSTDLETSHVIPSLIRKYLEAQREEQDHIVVWGTGTATRDFMYVEDAAHGILQAARHYDDPRPLNLGTGIETSILELTEILKDVIGFKGQVVWDRTKPDGQPRRCLDVSRAEEIIGFKASTSLREGLQKTVRWYQKHLSVAEISPPGST